MDWFREIKGKLHLKSKETKTFIYFTLIDVFYVNDQVKSEDDCLTRVPDHVTDSVPPVNHL